MTEDAEIIAQLRRRRAEANRCEPLSNGLRDPLDAPPERGVLTITRGPRYAIISGDLAREIVEEITGHRCVTRRGLGYVVLPRQIASVVECARKRRLRIFEESA